MENKEQIRACIYIRVSTEDQALGGSSLEEQERKCRAYCESKSWQVYKVYKDSESGRNFNRPKLTELLIDAGKRLFSIVVVYKLDRMSRNIRNMHRIIERLDKLDVSFASITETFDTSTSVGRLMFNIISSFAEFESDSIGERAYMGMLGKARKSNYNGGTVPDGYKAADGKLVIDKDRVEIVRLIFNLYSYGNPETKREMGTRTIAEWLNKRGYKTKQHITKISKVVLGGKIWNSEGVRRILSNPVYYGAYTWNKYRIKRTDAGVISKKRDPEDWIVIENAHDAIISKEMFLSIKNKLKSKQKVNVRGMQENYLFSGLLHFAPCGVQLEGWKKERGNYVDRYYRCNPAAWKRIRRINKDEMLTPYCKDCKTKSVRRDIVEPFLMEQIKRLKDRLPEIHELAEKVKQQATEQTEGWTEQEKDLTRKKNTLEWEKKSLYESLRRDEISSQDLGKRLKKIAKQENELDDNLFVVRTRSTESLYVDQNTEIAEDLIMQFAEAVNNANEQQKKTLIQAIIKKVDISKTGKVDITFRLPIKNISDSLGVVSPLAA